VAIDLVPVDGNNELIVGLAQEAEEHHGKGDVLMLKAGVAGYLVDFDLEIFLRSL
jgi:hypothetical protein